MLRNAGFDVTEVKNADFPAFDSALTQFAQKEEHADIALFYFAGHGFALKGDDLRPRNYLMSTSADIAAKSDALLRRDGMTIDEIIDRISGPAKVTIAFVDACRNDPFHRGAGDRGFEPIAVPLSRQIYIGMSDSDRENRAGRRQRRRQSVRPSLRRENGDAGAADRRRISRAAFRGLATDRRPAAAGGPAGRSQRGRDHVDESAVTARLSRRRPDFPTAEQVSPAFQANKIAPDVRAILGVDDGERHALRRPLTKLPEGDVSAVRRVIEAAASVALHKDRLGFRRGFHGSPLPAMFHRHGSLRVRKTLPLQPIERFFHHGHAGFHRRGDGARHRVRQEVGDPDDGRRSVGLRKHLDRRIVVGRSTAFGGPARAAARLRLS